MSNRELAGIRSDLNLGDARIAEYRAEMSRVIGPVIENALLDPKVGDIYGNANGCLLFRRHGELGFYLHPQRLDEEMRRRICQVALSIHNIKDVPNRTLFNVEMPFDGARVTITAPPTSDGWEFTMRKRTLVRRSLRHLQDAGVISEAQRIGLQQAIVDRQTILVSGGTGAGKTVFMQALLDYLVSTIEQQKTERLIIIEHNRELFCEYAQAVMWRTDYGTSMMDLTHHSLRADPDRILTGELRDAAALPYLKGITTGHPGALLTIHANSAAHSLIRLCDMAQENGPIPSITSLVAEAIQVVTHIRKLPDGSRRATVEYVKGPGRNAGSFITEPMVKPGSARVTAV